MRLPFSELRQRARQAEAARLVSVADVEKMHAQAAELQDAIRAARMAEIDMLNRLCAEALTVNQGVFLRYENGTLVEARVSTEVPAGEIHQLHVTKLKEAD